VIAILVKLIHFVVCIGLIVIVLLQADKGEGLAGAFGGGAAGTVFGERGGGGFIAKLTTGMAIIFMITSLIISIWLPKWEASSSSPSLSSPPSSTPMGLPVPGMPAGVPMPGGTPAPLPDAVPGGQ
jgi:preprotein translocase subunit SecG